MARTLEVRGREDVEIDPASVDRLVANLCDNALHYNVPRGNVEISTGRSHGTVLPRIANTGPVVPPEKVDELFEPFQHLHRTADDGHQVLGLSIMRGRHRPRHQAHRARPGARRPHRAGQLRGGTGHVDQRVADESVRSHASTTCANASVIGPRAG
ncbi:ATP-binding protein [Streptomyces sp. NPDC051636]|uniref:ATP-binding protein n=1 Tax=Streptomyces sp. NPDC051636 TaxID=3365663 RepID=UPI0037A851AD